MEVAEMVSEGLFVTEGLGVRQEQIALHAVAKDLRHLEGGFRGANHAVEVLRV